MSFNTKLAREIIAEIEKNPQQWNQSQWWSVKPECGTAYCFAGWACVLDGLQPIRVRGEYLSEVGYTMVDPDGGIHDVESYALDRLFPDGDYDHDYHGPDLWGELEGALEYDVLTNGDALTYGRNSLDQIKQVVDYFDQTFNNQEDSMGTNANPNKSRYILHPGSGTIIHGGEAVAVDLFDYEAEALSNEDPDAWGSIPKRGNQEDSMSTNADPNKSLYILHPGSGTVIGAGEAVAVDLFAYEVEALLNEDPDAWDSIPKRGNPIN